MKFYLYTTTQQFLIITMLLLANLSIAKAQGLKPGQSVTNPTGKKVTYHLTVNDTVMKIGNKKQKMLATNGQVPAPTLEFTEGDTADIFVHNATNKTVSFHWHGLLLPNKFDGVPQLTTELINAGETYHFKFPLIQNGTYWYHSHTGLDEQKGQYGPFIIHPKQPLKTKEKVIHLSDFTTESPWEVWRSLKRHTDWYAIKRNAVQSYGKAIATGNLGSKAWIEWKRMPDMDLADVYYQYFLANGKPEEIENSFKPGDRVRLRVINGSASSHFWFQFAGGKMTVVSADGLEVEPVEVDKMFIATAETYDVEITIPENGQYEFRATSWDVSNHASVWFGEGEKHPAPQLPAIDYFALVNQMKDMMGMMPNMTMGRAPKEIEETKIYEPGKAPKAKAGGMMEMQMGEKKMKHTHMHGKHQTKEKDGMKMESDTSKGEVYNASEMDMGKMKNPLGTPMTGYKQIQKAFPKEKLLNYDMLRSEKNTSLPNDNPTRVIHLHLAGNMLRYVWTINNMPLSKADKIKIEKGENIRFVMHNTTMMSHPMHLHGHFFRVVNKQGTHSPLKHTVNIAPMEMVTIEFEATEDKDWFFHCHLLYHMMSGMARTISYEGSTPRLNTEKKYKKFANHDKKFFPYAEAMVHYQGIFGEAGIQNIYWQISAEGKANLDKEYELEPTIMRYFGPKQFFTLYVGGNFERELEKNPETNLLEVEQEQVGTFGLMYLLPMHLWSGARLDHKGNVQLSLAREEIPLTQRWRIGAEAEYTINTNAWEYNIHTHYILLKNLAVSANYHNEYGFGAGITLIY